MSPSTAATPSVSPSLSSSLSHEHTGPVTPSQIPEDLWVFGYASVIWKHGEIPHTEAQRAHINGYKRRLWQGSADHRGTKLFPGRVAGIFSPLDFARMGVTEKDAEQVAGARDPWRVHGMAFRVTPEYRDQVVSELNVRETDYTTALVPLYQLSPDGSEKLFVQHALTFVAPPANPSFQGFASHADVAAHVAAATGEAGTNTEYVRNLHVALTAMGCPDPHIDQITSLL